MRVVEVCSGAGGLSLALHACGHELMAHAEVDDYASRVLALRWPQVPNLGDFTTDEAQARVAELEPELLAGGIPCQGHSVAGRREGAEDERNLWPHFARLLERAKPRMFLVENVPGLLTVNNGRFMAGLLDDAVALGYSVEYDLASSAGAGAPHRRERVFIVGRNDGRMTWPQAEQTSLFPGYPETLPKAARVTEGYLFERQRRWPTPSSVVWPTPTAQDAKNDAGASQHERNTLPLNTAVAVWPWPTPRALTGGPESAERKQELGRTESGGGDLQAAVQNWATPRAGDAKQGPSSTAKHLESGDLMLSDEAVLWPTPARWSQDDADPDAYLARRERARRDSDAGNGFGLALDMAARMWPTATAGDSKDAGSRNTEGSKAHDGTSLTDAALQGSKTGRETVAAGRLNPDWVEALMGWPVGWTNLDCAAPQPMPYPWPMRCGPDDEPLYGASSQAAWEPPRLVQPSRGDNRRHRLRCIGNGVELGCGYQVVASLEENPK